MDQEEECNPGKDDEKRGCREVGSGHLSGDPTGTTRGFEPEDVERDLEGFDNGDDDDSPGDDMSSRGGDRPCSVQGEYGAIEDPDEGGGNGKREERDKEAAGRDRGCLPAGQACRPDDGSQDAEEDFKPGKDPVRHLSRFLPSRRDMRSDPSGFRMLFCGNSAGH